MTAASNGLSASVRVRLSGQDPEVVAPPGLDVDVQILGTATPWRTFRFHKEQRHYSGSYWSATEGSLVIYESRLELARLLFADFDRLVRGIVAQPFLLETDIDGRRRRHVPDYLLLTDSVPAVVDVKPSTVAQARCGALEGRRAVAADRFGTAQHPRRGNAAYLNPDLSVRQPPGTFTR
ncbi:TnsA-like heteromeric transposase endonuclease subunit [Amycolatopsis sp. NPDC058278]|uniref:TnsA-like heteromeric transposase endonuclease subunit n=1 Tax=Amycolatopsis sp. NPDC058278 TaxID=3346417 RepID=UPI0036D7F4B7